MTRKLEEVLGLPDSTQILNDAKKEESKKKSREYNKNIDPPTAFRNIEELNKIENALPQVSGLGKQTDSELNDIADKALTAYDDLMDLGMNVEARLSGRIFEVASSMLKTSLDARVAKLDKKLKMVELQIKKEKNEQVGKPSKEVNNEVSGEGYVVTDRNSLIEKLKGFDK